VAEEAASLPTSTLERLREACSLSSVTGARESFEDLVRLGLGDGDLARCLRECLGHFDLTPIAELIGEGSALIEAAARV
jgi:hypothetical protein